MRNEHKLTPAKIQEINWGYAKTLALATAVELDIFTHIVNGKKTIEEIVQATQASRRGIEMLVNALTGLKLLIKDKDDYFHLTPDANEFLVQGRPYYLGDMSPHSTDLIKTWLHLSECVRTGKPYRAVNKQEIAEEYFSVLVRALFQMNYPAAKYAALYLKRKHKRISDILDVAAGSGVWSIAIAEQFKLAKVSALDFSGILNITREYVNKYRMNDRYKYIEKDLRNIDFGRECYDLVILGHICHSEGRIHTRQLIKKSFRSLKDGGSLLIAEFLPNNKKTRPLMPLLFALNMLINTDEGDVFTSAEFKEWLSASGFKNVEILNEAPSVSPLILAVK